jgi:hypothetical protein
MISKGRGYLRDGRFLGTIFQKNFGEHVFGLRGVI